MIYCDFSFIIVEAKKKPNFDALFITGIQWVFGQGTAVTKLI